MLPRMINLGFVDLRVRREECLKRDYSGFLSLSSVPLILFSYKSFKEILCLPLL